MCVHPDTKLSGDKLLIKSLLYIIVELVREIVLYVASKLTHANEITVEFWKKYILIIHSSVNGRNNPVERRKARLSQQTNLVMYYDKCNVSGLD